MDDQCLPLADWGHTGDVQFLELLDGGCWWLGDGFLRVGSLLPLGENFSTL